MRVTEGGLAGILVVEPDVHADARGHFCEVWHLARYAASGIGATFVQDNMSVSERGVLRGLHLQYPALQGKLITVFSGEVFDVAVDVRVGSPHFGEWWGLTLSGDTVRQVYIPEGFAHGFCATSDRAVVHYKCTGRYHKPSEVGIAWDDPDIGIDWPVKHPHLSPKDAAHPCLAEVPPERLPRYNR